MLHLIKNHYRKTNFKTGGLLEGEIVGAPRDYMLTPRGHVYPRKLDFRDACLQSSNQDNTPHCAGYSTAGYIEIKKWQKRHYPEQFDGDAIYYEAKKLDGRPNVKGTRLQYSAQAAINLGLIDGDIQYIGKNRDDIKCAIHSHWACIAGFNITNEWNMVNGYGIIKNLGDRAVLIGGHAVLICGYSDEGIYIQNSWGTSWGLYGFGLLSWGQVDKQLMEGVIIA